MTWVDAIVIALLLVYCVLGYFSGLIRRVVGFLALFVAFGAATYMASQAGSMLQQVRSGIDAADAHIYAFYGIMALILIVIEGLAAAYHGLLQISYVIVNRASGLLLGAVTAGVLSTVIVFTLNGAGNPVGGSLDNLQVTIRNGVNGSLSRGPLLNSVAPPVVKLFALVVPGDPQRFFSVSHNT